MGTVIGVAFGQARSPTAVAVVQGERRGPPAPGCHFAVRFLQRLPVGMSYQAVAKRVGEIARNVASRAHRYPRVFADVTGFGEPILGLMKLHGGTVTAVYFNHGDRRVKKQSDEVHLGKAWLVARLQVLLQGGTLHIPRTPDTDTLTAELLNFEIQVPEDANDRYGAFRVGRHDDLVTALGLAVQEDPHPPRSPTRRVVYG